MTQATKTTAMKPRGLLYSLTVMSDLPKPLTASPSRAAKRVRASDQEAIGGCMGIRCIRPSLEEIEREPSVRLSSFAFAAEKEER